MNNHTGKIHLKKGDEVLVISGAYKGAKGEVLKVFTDTYRALIENVNVVKKHLKPTQENQGGIVEQEAPIHISNLMVVDPKTGDATRVGRKRVEGKLERYSKKTGEII